MTDSTNDERSWFLIHTNPRQEERATDNLRAWNVEILSPMVRAWRHNHFTEERFPIIKPLFPRYIFARFNLDSLFHKVRYARGVHELVGFGNGPVEVDSEVIDLIKSRVDNDGCVTLGNGLKPGDKVVIETGALKDFTGIFEREMKDSDRVVLLLNTVSYQAHVQLERSLLGRLNDSVCPA